MNKHLKRFSATLIAALVFIVLVGYLFLFEMRGNKEIDTRKTVFPSVHSSGIDLIKLKYPGHEVTLMRDGGKWFVTKESKRFNADESVIGNILSGISEMKIDKIASENASSLDDFGLKSPRVEAMFKTPDDEYKLSVGSETPLGLGTYVNVGGEDRVLIVDETALMPFLDKTENDFRDKRILALNEDKINKLIFRSNQLSFEVDRESGRWVGKDMPDYVQLDQDRVTLILKAFLNLKIDNFEIDEPMSLSAYGLVKPNAEIEIFEDDNSIRVLFGNKKENGDYYIKLDSESPVYSVSEYVFVQIPESIDDIRVRKVVDIDPIKVRGIDIREGNNDLSMRRIGDKWRLITDGKAKVNETKIKDLLNEIANLEVETFVDDNPPDLAPYGLDRPEIQITVTGPDDEKITILFGRKGEKKVYTKISGQDSIYKMSDVILSKINVSGDEFGK
jgi:hypothetical protein